MGTPSPNPRAFWRYFTRSDKPHLLPALPIVWARTANGSGPGCQFRGRPHPDGMSEMTCLGEACVSHNSSVAIAIKAPQRAREAWLGCNDDAPIRRGGVGGAMSTSGDLLIGVDIGGTFTDVVVRRPGAPSRIMKIPTTRSDPSIAVLEALKRMQAEWGSGAAGRRCASCTARRLRPTPCWSARAPRVGLITTEGFRDVLEIGRQMRHQMYELALDPETPTFLAPGRMRREVPERVSATGEVLRAARRSSRRAMRPMRWSRPGARRSRSCSCSRSSTTAHERRAREIIAARHPGRVRLAVVARSIRRSANTSAPSSPPSTPT